MKHLLITAMILSVPAIAIAAPPPNARPLSEIIRYIEARGDVRYFDEIEWDRDGYWEIEYIRMDGKKIKLRIDPVSGQPR
jgi:hypothetical protein